MKKFYLMMVLCTLFLITNCKDNKTYTLKYIYDYEQDLDDNQKLKLEKLFVEHEKKTSNEIVLVTVGDYGKENGNIDVYSLDFKAKHLIGKVNKDNGVLIVFSKKNSEVRITPGSGLLKIDKSGKTNYLLKSVMTPRFEKKKYFEGLWECSLELIKYLEENK